MARRSVRAFGAIVLVIAAGPITGTIIGALLLGVAPESAPIPSQAGKGNALNSA